MARKKKGNPINGWINLNKPLDMTSTQALAAVKRILKPQKAGHAGTLDPLASGVLPIALGEATKTVPYVQDAMKTYRFTVTWGEQRSTDDAEGEVIATSDDRPTREEIDALLPLFIGDIEQTPPQFSAIKVNGERAYDIARDGEQVELQSRPVYIEALGVINTVPAEEAGQKNASPVCYAGEKLAKTSFECHCGKGTYVRAIARDLGEKLGCFGYISHLERIAVGPMRLENAISLDFLTDLGDNPPQDRYLTSITTALDDIPVLAVRTEEAARLKNGQHLLFVSRPDQERLSQIGLSGNNKDLTLLASYDGKAIAIATMDGPEVKPVRILNL